MVFYTEYNVQLMFWSMTEWNSLYNTQTPTPGPTFHVNVNESITVSAHFHLDMDGSNKQGVLLTTLERESEIEQGDISLFSARIWTQYRYP